MRLLDRESFGCGEGDLADRELLIAATREELITLKGSIGEALEAAEKWEFQTRLGITPEEAFVLIDKLFKMVTEATPPQGVIHAGGWWPLVRVGHVGIGHLSRELGYQTQTPREVTDALPVYNRD